MSYCLSWKRRRNRNSINEPPNAQTKKVERLGYITFVCCAYQRIVTRFEIHSFLDYCCAHRDDRGRSHSWTQESTTEWSCKWEKKQTKNTTTTTTSPKKTQTKSNQKEDKQNQSKSETVKRAGRTKHAARWTSWKPHEDFEEASGFFWSNRTLMELGCTQNGRSESSGTFQSSNSTKTECTNLSQLSSVELSFTDRGNIPLGALELVEFKTL